MRIITLKKDAEIVSTEPIEVCITPPWHRLFQQLRDCLQQMVAHCRTVKFVDMLETVDVDENQCGIFHTFILLDIGFTIAKTRQMVGNQGPLELLLGTLETDKLFFGVENEIENDADRNQIEDQQNHSKLVDLLQFRRRLPGKEIHDVVQIPLNRRVKNDSKLPVKLREKLDKEIEMANGGLQQSLFRFAVRFTHHPRQVVFVEGQLFDERLIKGIFGKE